MIILNVLYICNGNREKNRFKTAAWIEGLIADLINIDSINLSIAYSSFGCKKLEISKINNILYYCYPTKIKDPTKYDINSESHLKEIINSAKPNIVHVFGTEYSFCLATVNACNELGIIDNMVISIQGLISIIYKHYHNGLPNSVVNSFTIRDLLRWDNIKLQMEKFRLRGENEIVALQNAKYVIGRTTFDKAVSSQINQNLDYHFCNETLRSAFYKNRWDINSCEKYSIFLSQSYYPIKGFHYMLEAMSLILKRFPNAHIYTTGNDVANISSYGQKLRQGSYKRYLSKLIKKYQLEKHVAFLGHLSEEQMCERYLKSNVFVCPSSIENSPNSLGEAMILGVPCVASDVGGVSDMLKHKEEGFVYQADAPYMLAYYVCEIFEKQDLASSFSKKAREHALKTHDRAENVKRLMGIYKKIYLDNNR